MSERVFLSKSTFIRGLQCEKSLYLHKKRPFLRDRLSEEQLAKFNRGHKVGYLARELFPGGEDVSPKSHFQMNVSIKQTAELIRKNTPVIYEAAFEYKGVRVAVDLLFIEAGKWKAVEVKSSAGISETYLWDAALQYYVITGSGLKLEDFSLAYINYGYIREKELSVEKLFVVESVLELILKKQNSIIIKVEQLRHVSQLGQSPEIAVGPHCTDPYPCDFIGHCWKKFDHRPDVIKLGIDNEACHDLVNQINKPVAFFSSLYFKPAIPPFAGFSPYQKLIYALGLESLSKNGDDGVFEVAGPEGPVSCEQVLVFLEAMMAYNSIVVFDKETELEHLKHLCLDNHRVIRYIASLSYRFTDIKSVFELPEVISSDNKMPGNPEEALPAIDLSCDIAPGILKTHLSAAAHYQEILSCRQEENMPDPAEIKLFHKHSLQNLRLLFHHVTQL